MPRSSNDDWCGLHQCPLIDGRCERDIHWERHFDQAEAVERLRMVRRATLRAERELIERRMYADTMRLRDIRIELDAMPADPAVRMDG